MNPSKLLVTSPWLLAGLILAVGCSSDSDLSGNDDGGEPPWEAATGNCIACHEGIEVAHPYFPLGCAQCHGGNPRALVKNEAHVLARAPLPQDATTLPLDYFDNEYLRFLNPSNLRVVGTTCGQSGQGLGTACHQSFAEDLFKSMMATTAGHLAGGAYQNGILPDRGAIWSNMPVTDDDGDVPVHLGAVASLDQIPAELDEFPADSFEHHYGDVPRKICARCHLWSRGKAVRGIPGQAGNYRSEGCAACHMPYTNEALSESQDPTRIAAEVGHPRVHTLTRKIPTDQCGHCHTRGARIGLSFQGLSQLPPGTATGPGYEGLTPEKIYGAYHVQNPEVNPPDIHFERGMHCIDCHVRVESMGDGNIYGHMDAATQIECTDCHGMPDAYGSMRTESGTPHEHLRWDNGQMLLTGKVDGVVHVVPQVKDIVDSTHPSFNPVAAGAMTSDHLKPVGGLECYACHSAWQNNCYGCHFDRDLGESSLDYFAGEKTRGKPATNDKYFLNYKNFHMGYNAEGKVAPFVTGCQVLATVRDEFGELVLEQELPVTANGLSGLSLNPVQPHTVRDTPRSCTECHRNPAALGLGTESYNLSRDHLYLLSPSPTGALTVVDRSDTSLPVVVGSVQLPDPRELLVLTNPITGTTTVAFVADGTDGLVAIDLTDPTAPSVASRFPLADARALARAGQTLYVANGAQGVSFFDLTDPRNPVLVASIATTDARGLSVHGLHLLVADGAGGLTILDVQDRENPSTAAVLDLNGADASPNSAHDVVTFAHYSNPPAQGVKAFSMLAYVADGPSGVRIVDIAAPGFPSLLTTFPTTDARTVFAKSHYVTGDSDTASIEHEFLFVADGPGGIRAADISDPAAPVEVPLANNGMDVTDFVVANAFEPPANRLYVYAALGAGGCAILDWSVISSPVLVDTLNIPVVSGLDIQRIRLDRLCDEDGVQIKDTSHEGARTFTREEMETILEADY